MFCFSTSAPIGILVDSDWQADVVIQSLAQPEVTSTFQTLSMGSRINRINPAKINPKDFFFFFLKFAHSSSSPLTLRIWDVCGLTSATKLSKLVFWNFLIRQKSFVGRGRTFLHGSVFLYIRGYGRRFRQVPPDFLQPHTLDLPASSKPVRQSS